MTESGEPQPEAQNPTDAERLPTDPASHPDFDRLVTKAFAEPIVLDADELPDATDQNETSTEAPPISIEDLDNLWAAFLNLEEWIFLVKHVPGSEPFPFIGKLEDALWLFLFTDHERLRRFADARGMLDLELNAHFITMSPLQSLEWLARLHGSAQEATDVDVSVTDQVEPSAVYGIRINEGPHGWYAPLESLSAIYGHLKELDRI